MYCFSLESVVAGVSLFTSPFKHCQLINKTKHKRWHLVGLLPVFWLLLCTSLWIYLVKAAAPTTATTNHNLNAQKYSSITAIHRHSTSSDILPCTIKSQVQKKISSGTGLPGQFRRKSRKVVVCLNDNKAITVNTM